MFLAAFASIRSPASKAFYERKRAEGQRHNAAVICLARRRCDVILAMLKTRPPTSHPPPTDSPEKSFTRLDKKMGAPPARKKPRQSGARPEGGEEW